MARVVFHPAALRELADLYDYVADRASETTADRFAGALRDFCRQLALFPERGTVRDDIGQGIRIIGFRRSVSVAFAVEDGDRVLILGIFGAGRNVTAELLEERRD